MKKKILIIIIFICLPLLLGFDRMRMDMRYRVERHSGVKNYILIDGSNHYLVVDGSSHKLRIDAVNTGSITHKLFIDGSSHTMLIDGSSHTLKIDGVK